MRCSKQTYFVEFNGKFVSLDSQVAAVSKNIEELFKDLLAKPEKSLLEINNCLIKAYVVEQSDDASVIVKQADQVVYAQTGGNAVEVANVLMNHIKLDLLSLIDASLVLHAGLVSYLGESILLPGNSGNGKSLTTLGLLSLGCQYHTDEVVLQDLNDDSLSVFVRPLMIKPHGLEAARSLIGSELDNLIIEGASMHSLPIDALQAFFAESLSSEKLSEQVAVKKPPPIACIVFPCYDAASTGELIPLTPAQTMIQLFKNNVVARNLPDLGAMALKKLSMQAKAVKLNYAGYHQLPELFKEIQVIMRT